MSTHVGEALVGAFLAGAPDVLVAVYRVPPDDGGGTRLEADVVVWGETGAWFLGRMCISISIVGYIYIYISGCSAVELWCGWKSPEDFE